MKIVLNISKPKSKEVPYRSKGLTQSKPKYEKKYVGSM